MANNPELPKSLTSISAYFLYGCKSLTEIKLPYGLKMDLKWEGGEKSFPDINEEFLSRCIRLKSITIPEGITQLGKRSLNDNRDLSKLILPRTLTRIGKSVLNNCPSLKSLTLPDDITDIGNDILLGSKHLKSLMVTKGSTTEKTLKSSTNYDHLRPLIK